MRRLFFSWVPLLAVSGCTIRSPQPGLDDQDVRLTILHTADAHSKLLPYRFAPTQTYVKLGLDPDTLPQSVEEYTVGGADRLAYLLRRERSRAARVIHLDSGDGYQGAPIFNIWQGEAESRVMTELGVNAQVIGNHEFDTSAQNFAEKLETWADYPVLAANYIFEDETKPWNNTLRRVAQPWTVIDAQGLRVGVVGMANLDSLTSVTEQGNSLGVIPLETVYAAEIAVEQVRHMADLVVLVTHMGPDEDRLIAENVKHIDVIMGGHLHLALDPPMVAQDPDGRDVLIVHSNALLRFLGRIDLVLRKPSDPELAAEYGFEVESHKWRLFPIDNRVDFEIARPNKSPHEVEATKMAVRMRNILEEYRIAMASILDFNRTVGCSSADRIERFGEAGGDSPLGNIVAEAMQTHHRVQTDFALTNAGGIREDLRGRILDRDDPRACIQEDGTMA
ncbi:MAG: metallophosphoesterase [Myxococcota bacterium]